MQDQLIRKGFPGVTFSVRDDIKYGIRAIPYYQYDGSPEELYPIKMTLFKEGIQSSISSNKLRVSGINSCIALAGILNINNEWTTALREIFLPGLHRTEDGIKKLFQKFGTKSLLTQEELCRLIDTYKEHHSNLIQIRAMENLKMLPVYDHLYDTIDIVHMPCQQCRNEGVHIYFSGKYPRPSNIAFLCTACADNL
jgi:hypothetical protein